MVSVLFALSAFFEGGYMQTKQGFFGSLFDFSFSSLVATRIIKVLYILAVIVIGLYALVFIVAAFGHSPAAGAVVLLVLAPLFSLVSLIYVRVLLEVVIALFRIMENTGELVNRTPVITTSTSPASATSGPTPPAPA